MEMKTKNIAIDNKEFVTVVLIYFSIVILCLSILFFVKQHNQHRDDRQTYITVIKYTLLSISIIIPILVVLLWLLT